MTSPAVVSLPSDLTHPVEKGLLSRMESKTPPNLFVYQSAPISDSSAVPFVRDSLHISIFPLAIYSFLSEVDRTPDPSAHCPETTL